jgi:hypothetical protein
MINQNLELPQRLSYIDFYTREGVQTPTTFAERSMRHARNSLKTGISVQL